MERLKGLIDKIPRDQCFAIDVAGVGRVDLKLRIFVSNSEDSRAIDHYIRANPTQTPAPFVLLAESLPLTAIFNPAVMDPQVEADTTLNNPSKP